MYKRLIVKGYWGPTDPILQVPGPEPIIHRLTTQPGTIDRLGNPCMASSAPAHQTTPSQPNGQHREHMHRQQGSTETLGVHSKRCFESNACEQRPSTIQSPP